MCPILFAGAGGGRGRREARSMAWQPIYRLWPLLRGAVKPLRWDKGATEPWDTGLLLEKTLAVLQAPSLCVIPCTAWSSANLQKPELEKRASKVERELWDRLTSVTELACVSQADPEAITLT